MDIMVRNIAPETAIRLSEGASKMGLSRNAYISLILDNATLESQINERTRILMEVLTVSNEQITKSNLVHEQVEEMLEKVNIVLNQFLERDKV